ncbi:ATP-binding cassette sub-family A member 3-like [Hyposmocoma kahamanoa]|uniref:ATP-binding cassette sub-family A member 3-like n=1 Tax=Hyposmocoma kahamanoa TaxID=1477025 RepID=UPI000E6DA0B1|nr:ATP-binding cassette sub-family A member 3-like [Hyposmocoma kahamanoa]
MAAIPFPDALAMDDDFLYVYMCANNDFYGGHSLEPVPYPLSKQNYRNLDLLLYTPDTNQTRQLTDKVGPKLNLSRSDHLPDGSVPNKKYIGIEDEIFLENFVTTRKDHKKYDMDIGVIAIVIFHNMENTQLPSHLRYTIRIDEDLNYSDQRKYSLIGSHNKIDKNYPLFMRVQWAIDSSYLELQGADIEKLKLTLQEFDDDDDDDDDILSPKFVTTMLHIACFLSLYLPFVFLMAKLLQERTSGVQEFIKILGVPVSLLNLSHILNVLPTGLVFSISGAIFLTMGKLTVIPKTNPWLIFFMLLLYFVSVMALAFACSFITKNAQYAVTLSSLAYVVSYLPMGFLASMTKTNIVVLGLTGLLPHIPTYWFWKEVVNQDAYKAQGPINIFVQHTPLSGSVFACYMLLFTQTIIFFFIAWYCSKVCPGNYGTPLPLNFLFKSQYWIRKKAPHSGMEGTEKRTLMPNDRDSLYFEKPLDNAEVGIRIANLTKLYNTKKALDNVSLDVYKGEITVLLGHNGAGKTTLMSIIAGLISATEGTVTINGLDSVQHQEEVRQQIGLCPQDNIFFSDLTVLEHVMFCAMLKGYGLQNAKVFSLELLDRLYIASKANSMSKNLSGGMTRRLQLACALAGSGNVLILDEPTLGLDIENRRELWKLLLSLRGERTVLLTTHFMEEADALGDRVAALHAGRLRALATPIYLKNNIGTGYRLTLTTTGLQQENAITSLVTTYVPDATLKERSSSTLEYSLPSASSKNFSALFTELQNKRLDLGINSIGVGVSTLEEVFLKLCSDIETALTEDTDDRQLRESTYPKVRGSLLLLIQMGMLMKRHIKYLYFRKWSFLFLQLLIPIILIFGFTYVSNDRPKPEIGTRRAMDLGIFKDMKKQPRVFYKLDYKDHEYLNNFRRFGTVDFQQTANMTDAMLRVDRDSRSIAGVELKGDNAKVYYSTTVRHAALVALNLLSNLLAAKHDRYITTYSQPLQGTNTAKIVPKTVFTTVVWALCILFLILSTVSNTIYRLIKDRQTGIRHIHIMAGCPPFIHWMATFITHVLMYTVISVLPTLIAASIMDENNTINTTRFLSFTFVVLELVIMAFLAFMYFVSFGFGERTTVAILTVSVTLGGKVNRGQ